MSEVIAIDLGGTKINGALVDDTFTVGPIATTPTPNRDGGEAVVEAIATVIAEVMAAAPTRPAGIGIGTAGVVDPSGRWIVSATDAIRGWASTPVADLLEARFDLPVVMINDVHAHALGELVHGGAKGHQSLLMIAVGTGVGGAIATHGEVLTGAHGIAGHVGHMEVPLQSNRPCSCGREANHLEKFASGPGMVQWYHELGGTGVANARELEEQAATAGLARSVYADAGYAIGTVAGSLVNIFDPEVVVIGGGIARSGDVWWEPLTRGYREQLMDGVAGVPLINAVLGDRAALVGAAHLIRTHISK